MCNVRSTDFRLEGNFTTVEKISRFRSDTDELLGKVGHRCGRGCVACWGFCGDDRFSVASNVGGGFDIWSTGVGVD